MSYIDIFEKYYSFAKLPTDNKFYLLKKENYELVKKLYTENATELPTFPLRATIQTTDFCNLNCIMCQIHSQRDKHKLQSMKRANFDLFADKLFPYLVEVHPSNIGEPMISDWFDYLCDKAVEYGVLLDITSNGTLLTEAKIQKILPNLLDIKISIDGIKKATFERIRKNANYDVVVKNINNLLRLRDQEQSEGTITLQMTLFNFNYKELLDLIRFAKDKSIDRVKAYHVHSYSDEINQYSLFNDLQQFEEIRLQAIELAERLNIALELSEPEVENNATTDLLPQKCRLLWAECFIDSNGVVYPCHTHNFIPLGNIFTDSVSAVWNSNYAVKLRQTLTGKTIDTNAICQNCGMNYLKYDENQPVPYNKSDFLYGTPTEAEPVKWSKRNKQFLIKR
jgi:radical SAM protein with 4Fe4S-binding SPASM domain